MGAGDAFAAVLILGECLKWDLRVCLDRAVEFADALVGNRGATSADRTFYTPFRQRWQLT